MRGAMHSGPVIIGFDGQPASELALREAAAPFAPRPAVVVIVWEAGRAFEAATIPEITGYAARRPGHSHGGRRGKSGVSGGPAAG